MPVLIRVECRYRLEYLLAAAQGARAGDQERPRNQGMVRSAIKVSKK